MIKKKNTIAIVLARGGSKGIPNKNIKSFLGKPLLVWTIIQARISKNISKVYLSSDSEKILRIGKRKGWVRMSFDGVRVATAAIFSFFTTARDFLFSGASRVLRELGDFSIDTAPKKVSP